MSKNIPILGDEDKRTRYDSGEDIDGMGMGMRGGGFNPFGGGAQQLPSTLVEDFLVDLEVFIINLAELWKYTSQIVLLCATHSLPFLIGLLQMLIITKFCNIES